MNPLTQLEKRELTLLIESGEPWPDKWRQRLFPQAGRIPETGKEYRLVYDGKLKREEVLAQTPPAPWCWRSLKTDQEHAVLLTEN